MNFSNILNIASVHSDYVLSLCKVKNNVFFLFSYKQTFLNKRRLRVYLLDVPLKLEIGMAMIILLIVYC